MDFFFDICIIILAAQHRTSMIHVRATSYL